jgi:hypothetical protein
MINVQNGPSEFHCSMICHAGRPWCLPHALGGSSAVAVLGADLAGMVGRYVLEVVARDKAVGGGSLWTRR